MLVIIGVLAAAVIALGVVVIVQRKKINNFDRVGAALVREAEKVRKNNDHYLKFAEDVLVERDRAMRLYQMFGQATSVAQNWLLRDLRTAIRELNAYRQKEGKQPVEVDRRLAALVDEYPQSVERTVPEVPPAILPDGLPLPSAGVPKG